MPKKTPKIYDEIEYKKDNYNNLISFLDDHWTLRTPSTSKIGPVYFTRESLDKAKVIIVNKLRRIILLSSQSFDTEFKKNLTNIAQGASA